MAKSRVTPIRPPRQAAPPSEESAAKADVVTLPLAEITVMWPRDPNDTENEPLTLDGLELGQILEWVRQLYRSRSAGDFCWTSPAKNMTDVAGIAGQLRGLGHIARALGDEALNPFESVERPEVMQALGASIQYFASRLIAAEMGRYTAKEATVTVPARLVEQAP